jgi:glycosyltransferase involved in cell wall biosynthesis
LKILVLPSWYPKNASDVSGVFFRDQALALQDYGHQVGVIAAYPYSWRVVMPKQNSVAEFEVDEEIPTYRSLFRAGPGKIPYLEYLQNRCAFQRLFSRYVREHDVPDIIHAHSLLYAGSVVAELGHKYKIPTVVTEHSTGFARHQYRLWQLRLARKSAAAINFRIAVSPFLGDILNYQIGSQWIWVPNVVASRFVKYPLSDSKTSARPVRLLNLALMTEKKGQADLLRAFAVAAEAVPETELWLGGDGSIRSQLEALSCELGIAQRVKFLGKIAPGDVPELLAQTDIMVIASHYETFGVVAAEALTMGRPVVATRCGGPACIVGEGDGLLVEPGNPEQMSAALVQIVKNLEQYNSEAIAQRARERFGGAAVARQLTAIYQRLLDQRTGNIAA